MDANWQNQLKDQMNKSMRNRPMEGEDLETQNEFDKVFGPLFQSLDSNERNDMLKMITALSAQEDKEKSLGVKPKTFHEQREGIKKLERFLESPESDALRLME